MLLCVPNSAFSCASCAVIPALCLSPLWCSFCALCVCIRACCLSVRCVRALSLFVCYYSCALCVACSRVSLCSVYSCIMCCDPTLCLSPMWCSFCALYVSMRAIYFSTMCACSISFRVLSFLVLCESYPYVLLCYIPCILACSL